MSIRLAAISLIASLFFVSGSQAADAPPVEAYGQLPTISIMALSPSGTRIAFRQTDGESDIIVVLDLQTGKSLAGISTGELKPRYLAFLDEDTVFARASRTTDGIAGRAGFELTTPYLIDIPSNEVKQIFRHSNDVFDNQSGLGRIIGQSDDKSVIYMPAFVTHRATTEPRYDLFHISTDGKTERQIAKGTDDTRSWFVDADGNPFIEVEYNDLLNKLRIFAREDGERSLVYEEETANPDFFPVALTKDRDALLFDFYAAGENYSGIYSLPISGGDLTGPVFAREDASINYVITDPNRVILGVEYSGFQPTYSFLDPEVDARVKSIQQMLRGTASELIDWTPDFSTLLFEIGGGWSSGAYVLAQKGAEKPRIIAQTRPSIPSAAVAPSSIIEYEAADGMKIPALLTAQKDLLAAGNMPLIVLPHGGPRAQDHYGFDWLAQFFASRGYAVFQPQFRGSTGFGLALRDGGNGEYGRKMSTDIDDGVRILIEEKLVDPDRMCVVGASYGGYAALAAGAFSDVGYSCIVAIAPVSDVHRKMAEAKFQSGEDSWNFHYWSEIVGADDSDLAALKEISPVDHAANFKAPVLLLHGKDDSVVPIVQSRVMEDALKDAGKDVEFIKLDGEDHWLSSGETRLATLKAIEKFLKKNL